MNRFQLLKLLAPGFLPIVVFIVVDSFLGLAVGLIVAVAFGVIELGIDYYRRKKLDRFILLDTALIVVLGGVSYAWNDPVFFKLKPALIGSIFCLLLGVSVFSPLNLILLMTRRYLKQMSVGEEQVRRMKSSMRLLFFVFLFHTALTAYSAFCMSQGAWAFISGGLFYILFGLVFAIEWIRRRFFIGPAMTLVSPEEWVDLVDADGRIVGRATRTQVHAEKGLLHPVVHLHVIHSDHRIFLQKRSMTKEIQPGKWDTAVGGHVCSGESIEQALRREAKEELGLTGFAPRFLGRYAWESEIESELVFLFVLLQDTVPCINRGEMDEGKFWRIKKIKENLESGIFTPNFVFEFPLLLREFFKIDIGMEKNSMYMKSANFHSP